MRPLDRFLGSYPAVLVPCALFVLGVRVLGYEWWRGVTTACLLVVGVECVDGFLRASR